MTETAPYKVGLAAMHEVDKIVIVWRIQVQTCERKLRQPEVNHGFNITGFGAARPVPASLWSRVPLPESMSSHCGHT
jgi:hypothetical protein